MSMDNGKINPIDFDALYDSMRKCRKGVIWKPSVKSFVLNDLENVLRMEEKLKNGTWKNGTPKPILITYPKKREGLSIPFRDRVYQRSLNDNELYPAVAKSLIADNCACQIGKGTDYAIERWKEHMRRFYRKHGLDGWLLQTDIHGYYPSMQHESVKGMFGYYVSGEVLGRVCGVLDDQYTGETGYNPGSQMVQIAGIGLLNPLDHYIKERLRMEHYQRYQDDSLTIHHDRKALEQELKAIREWLGTLGLALNEKKTHIQSISEPFDYLGFTWRMTETGKIIMIVKSETVKHERRKLRRLVKLAKQGKRSRAKVDECYAAWKNYISKGNAFKVIARTDAYYKKLWEEKEYENYTCRPADPTGQAAGGCPGRGGYATGSAGEAEPDDAVCGRNGGDFHPGGGKQ